MGLNITVHSYLDELTFGLISCRELVPDLWKMVDLHIDEIDRLFEATGAEWAVPPRPAPPRRGPARRRAVSAATAAKPAKKATKSTKKASKKSSKKASKASKASKATRRTKQRAPAKAAS